MQGLYNVYNPCFYFVQKSDGMELIKRKAYAKINLGLDITGRRADGYHYINTVMQTVDLYDVITLSALEEPDVIRIECSDPAVPSGESNLAYRAARLVMDAHETGRGVLIKIEKNIPMAAGLAGGSTDAGAVILGMNALFGLGMTQDEMDGMAVRLGADVAFCLRTGTWLGQGIGEELTPLPDAPSAWALIVNDGFEVSTKWVYTELDAAEITDHPDIEALCDALEKQDLRLMSAAMGNVLETVTIGRYPQINELKQKMTETGAIGALMSGSGPTVFGIYDSKAAAEDALRQLKEEAGDIPRRCFSVQFVRNLQKGVLDD